MTLRLLISVGMQMLVLLQLVLAHRDGFFTAAQMRSRGVPRGLPIAWHFGIWGDGMVISGLVAMIISECWLQWAWTDIRRAGSIALGAVVIFQLLWMTSATPEAHLTPRAKPGKVFRQKPSATGYAHDVYFVLAFTAFLMLYFWTPQPPRTLLIATSFILVAHVWVGNHMLLGLISCFKELPWYPDRPLRNPVGWTTVIVLAVALWWRTSILLAR